MSTKWVGNQQGFVGHVSENSRMTHQLTQVTSRAKRFCHLKIYNKLLRAASRTERLVQEKVLEKSGSPPVVGTKEVLVENCKKLL